MKMFRTLMPSDRSYVWDYGDMLAIMTSPYYRRDDGATIGCHLIAVHMLRARCCYDRA